MTSALLVGVISDTHGLLRPEALAALEGADHLVHAGDIGDPQILERLTAIAPLTSVRGNNDDGPWARNLPDSVTLTLHGVRLHVLHDRNALVADADALGYDVVIAGHSHRPLSEWKGGVLHFNPGSAGPRRFRLPITVGRLRLIAGRVEPEIVTLTI
jgi:putative phosphoesterase